LGHSCSERVEGAAVSRRPVRQGHGRYRRPRPRPRAGEGVAVSASRLKRRAGHRASRFALPRRLVPGGGICRGNGSLGGLTRQWEVRSRCLQRAGGVHDAKVRLRSARRPGPHRFAESAMAVAPSQRRNLLDDVAIPLVGRLSTSRPVLQLPVMPQYRLRGACS
jgi:hypothetical protein